ncbi:class A beta-lactamase-related serine hydrolase [Jiangella ureilytica]|uniref:Class A beta-lactamase-related serine hydrolase n=1 Tax=Jiangella ureilytica TaxID=2530374 RepID=A0A4V2XXL2_9ACTN|nr:serine hydrolase domain-containing protein [Jiangella ureilytica]TDC53265.1 class A beta-lactamase-related serine hydrolase [Jiangella ureilytica]
MTMDAARLRAWLTELIGRFDVPGATLGVLRDGQIVDVAAGVLSRATLVPATPDSVFQIGSITKVWTATLIMQLVDEGRLALDTPVVDVLPGFAVADPGVTRTVTVRHLLTHTSGIDGDVFVDTGRGDDAVERYVERLADVAQTHPLDATFSYCNSGFSVAGRIVEVLTGLTWDAAIRERIAAPLGLMATVTLPEDAILHRAAVGHLGEPGRSLAPTTVWALPRSGGPAGRITARVHDVLAFARMHLAGGAAPDGTRLLSTASAAAMTEHQVDVPDPAAIGDSWGLGWIRFDWDGHRLVGHDGGTVGQRAYLRVLPERDVAVCLLTNGGDTAGMYRELFAELADVTMPAPFAPPADPPAVDLRPYVGRYSRAGFDTDVFARDGSLAMRVTVNGLLGDLLPELSREHLLVPVAEGHFATRPEGATQWEPVFFYTLADGSRYLHHGVRANPRVEAGAEPR